jgi:type IV pilus assembly protein PilV
MLATPSADELPPDWAGVRRFLFLPPAPSPHPPACSGFTIIETLAALLVIAVGVIGVAALYLDNVHASPERQLHLQAADLAESIAVRIRENSAGRVGYAGTIGVVCDSRARSKTAQDAAAQEAACWEAEVERTLPSGVGSISRDLTTTPATYVVAVSWSAPESGAASYVIRVDSSQAAARAIRAGD